MAIWNSLRPFGIVYDHLVHFVLIWYIFSGFGIMYRKNLASLVRTAQSCDRFLHAAPKRSEEEEIASRQTETLRSGMQQLGNNCNSFVVARNRRILLKGS
jgi:hypothetical protein